MVRAACFLAALWIGAGSAQAETIAQLVSREKGVDFGPCVLEPPPQTKGVIVHAVIPARFPVRANASSITLTRQHRVRRVNSGASRRRVRTCIVDRRLATHLFFQDTCVRLGPNVVSNVARRSEFRQLRSGSGGMVNRAMPVARPALRLRKSRNEQDVTPDAEARRRMSDCAAAGVWSQRKYARNATPITRNAAETLMSENGRDRRSRKPS